jgi:hypothetical protein
MKILLITTGGNNNPGDQFIRVGIERLIRDSVPPGPTPFEFERIDKEDDADVSRERNFDRVIVCGMPLWWNNSASSSELMGWWLQLFRGWLAKSKRRLAVIGAGPALGPWGPVDAKAYRALLAESVEKSHVVTSRQPVMYPGIIDSVCPAAFAVDWKPDVVARLRLCNLMPAGAHDNHFDPSAAAHWEKRLKDISAFYRDSGYEFIAHSSDEVELATKLGWASQCIHFPSTTKGHLDLYRQCYRFFGNRLHGAMVAAATGHAVVAACGYDSRTEMLRPFTPHVYNPFSLPERLDLSRLEPRVRINYVEQKRAQLVDILKDFLAPIKQ